MSACANWLEEILPLDFVESPNFVSSHLPGYEFGEYDAILV
jgi:hypothetical protein